MHEQVAGSLAARISREMVGLMSRYTGRGPTKARTTINTNAVVVVLEDTLTKGERNLVSAGQGESVVQMRRTFNSLMRDDAVKLVEELTGRSVLAMLSDIDPERNVASKVFVFERRPEAGEAGAAGTDGSGPA